MQPDVSLRPVPIAGLKTSIELSPFTTYLDLPGIASSERFSTVFHPKLCKGFSNRHGPESARCLLPLRSSPMNCIPQRRCQIIYFGYSGRTYPWAGVASRLIGKVINCRRKPLFAVSNIIVYPTLLLLLSARGVTACCCMLRKLSILRGSTISIHTVCGSTGCDSA